VLWVFRNLCGNDVLFDGSAAKPGITVVKSEITIIAFNTIKLTFLLPSFFSLFLLFFISSTKEEREDIK